MPYVVGIAGLLVLWLFYVVFSGKWNPMELAKGSDGLPSSSMFQFLLWTVVVVFAYITIYVARAQHNEYGPITEIPVNLLILMGISSGAAVLSKGITVYHLSHGTAIKSGRVPTGYAIKYLICDDNGQPVLNKVQMMAWTFIAIGIYIFLITRQVGTVDLAILPNVDDSLLVLMGISQGTYLGKRMLSTTTPILRSLNKSTAQPGDDVIVSGSDFGDVQAGGIVRIDRTYEDAGGTIKVDMFYPSQIKEWKNDAITFVLPQGLSAGLHNILVVVGGKESSQLTIKITT